MGSAAEVETWGVQRKDETVLEGIFEEGGKRMNPAWKALVKLYEINLGIEWLNGQITEGQYKYRLQKVRKIVKQEEST